MEKEIKHFKTYEEYVKYYGVMTTVALSPTSRLDITDMCVVFKSLKTIKVTRLKVNDSQSEPRMCIHRLDGPAILYSNNVSSWYINNKFVHYEIHEWADELSIDLDNLSDEDKFLINVTWSQKY